MLLVIRTPDYYTSLTPTSCQTWTTCFGQQAPFVRATSTGCT